MDNLYQRLLDHFGGNQAAAANALRTSPQAVSNWKTRGIPKARAFDIEGITAGDITAREVLSAKSRIKPSRVSRQA